MKAVSILSVVLVAGLAACSGSGDSTGPTVASVTVTPASPTLDAIGATVQFSAKALDSNGSPVSAGTVTWSSATQGVATISSTGLATAVAAGTAEVRANIDGVVGSTVLTVDIPPPAPCTAPKTVSLAVGAYASYAASDCLLLPSGASGDRYRVALLRPVGTGDEGSPSSDTVTATLQVTGIGGVTQAPAPQLVTPAARAPQAAFSGIDPQTLRRSRQIQDATERFEAQMRARDEAMLARMRPQDRLPVRRPSTLLRAAAPADLPAKLTFDPTTPSDCKAGTPVTANLIYQNDDIAFYQDSTQQTTLPVTVAATTLMADYYSSYAKDMITAYFGENPDIDNNGKVIVFITPTVSGDAAAFVWSGDFFSKTACAASNERDMIWFNVSLIRALDAPDGNSKNWQALATVAHEAKHVVSLYNRIAAAKYHPTWIEEGSAEIAGEMSSRIAWAANGGPAVGARVTRSDFSNAARKWEYGVLVRMSRTLDYLQSQPNGLVVAPTGAGSGESIYGSGWHFERWLGDAYGNAGSAPKADSAFFRLQNDSLTAAGTQGLAQITGQSFSSLVEQFVEAISLHETGAPKPARAFSTYDFVTATDIFVDQPDGQYPWPVTTNGAVLTKGFSTATYAGPMGAWGMRIHDFVSNGTGTGAQLEATMPPGGRMIVVRLH